MSQLHPATVKAFINSLEEFIPTIKEHDAQTRDEDLLPTAKRLLKFAKARLPKEPIKPVKKQQPVAVIDEELDRWDMLEQIRLDIKSGLRSGEIKIDFKGHQRFPASELVDLSTIDEHQQSYYCDKIASGHSFIMLGTAREGKQKKAAELLISGADDWVELVKPSCLNDCGICGENMGYEINLAQKLVRAICEPCEFPGGIKEYVVDIDVPSGVLVIDDDLRHYFSPIRDHNVNQTIGIMKTSQDYADQDLIHMFVGNSCPSIYRAADGNSLLVGNNSTNDDIDGEELGTDETCEGGVCTDLWWVSMADLEFIKNSGNVNDEELEHLDTITVKPGRYRAKSYFHHSGYDAPLYFKVELLPELKPLLVDL